jgi:hypothetical protein
VIAYTAEARGRDRRIETRGKDRRKGVEMRKIKMNLRLFEGEGGASAAGSGSPAPAAEQMGENVQNTTGGTVEGEKIPEHTPEERQAAYERFKEEYKDLYGNDVREHINRRFKDEKKLQEQLDAYTPLMSMLGLRYGLQEPTVPNVMEAIDQDNSFWEEQALKENMTVDQLKHMRKLEADNQQLIDTVNRAQQIRQRDDTYARWDKEAELCKQRFPNFDMKTECQNPDFQRALGAGMSVETAYKAVHFDELTHGLMVKTEKDTKKKVADSIRSGSGRPTENGIGAGSANGTKVSAWDLSPEEFHKIMERAARGEKIII